MPPAENKNAVQQIIEIIQDMIMDGQLKAGDKLPPERAMTEQMGVGRPALREALKALEMMGVVGRRQGSGNYITGRIDSQFLKPLSLSFRLNHGKIENVLEVRYALEVLSVQEACRHADVQALAPLREAHEGLLIGEGVRERARSDRRFHECIADLSSNMLAATFLDSISYLLDSLYSQTVSLALEEDVSFEVVYKEHDKILRAIEARDPAAATAAMQNHLGHINRTFLKDSE